MSILEDLLDDLVHVADEQIAFARLLQCRHSLALHAQSGPCLRSLGNLQLVLAIQSWDDDFRPQCRLRKRNWH